MTRSPVNRRHTPVLDIDIEEITSRIKALTRIDACDRCEPALTATVFDAASAVMGIGRLYLRMLAERRRAADFEAAIRAALGAERDGEPDPLDFLRDEYASHGQDAFRGWGGADG
jgi:hypothetical protein